MFSHDLVLFSLFFIILIFLVKFMGDYLYQVYFTNKTALDYICKPLERFCLKLCGTSIQKKQTYKTYVLSLLIFSLVCTLGLFLLLTLQAYLPLNPQKIGNMKIDQAINTAVSFVTNTNWQSYSGGSDVSYLAQMLGLAVQNFISASVGLSVAIVLIRSLSVEKAQSVGNFWHDLIRGIIYVLLPLSLITAMLYVAGGVPQNFMPAVHVVGFDGFTQTIPQGPVASQEAIKSLGTNGGGFFNANSAMPYENPNMFTLIWQMYSILIIPAGLTYTFGRAVKSHLQGWLVFSIMSILFIASLGVMSISEVNGYKGYQNIGIHDIYEQKNNIANYEGKDVRFAIGATVLYNSASTSASNAGVSSMLDSYTPLAGAAAMANIALGGITFGGVGSGFCNFMMFFILSVFIGSLIAGRKPELFRRRVSFIHIRWVLIALLISPICILTLTALTFLFTDYKAWLNNPGPHGFSEILYAYISTSNNSGSSFAGLNANTLWMNITTAIAMLLGRFGSIIAVIVLAGALISTPHRHSVVFNRISTESIIFNVFVLVMILTIGGLSLFPTIALGPIADYLTLMTH